MTSLKSTRRALLSSLVSLTLCLVMLCSTTYAWFTDIAASNGNIIQAGNLKVGMYWADGDRELVNAGWNDASFGSIFDTTGWEPGHIDSKHIRIVNEGDLAFKYDLVLSFEGEVSALADVIDVYVVNYDTAHASTTDEPTSIGTLAELLSDSKSLVKGQLSPSDPDRDDETSEKIITVTLKMREGLGKEYQNLTLGSNFSVKLLATQLTYEGGSDDEGTSSPNRKVVTKEYHPLPNVKTDLPAAALAASPGVTFATSPYAYIDTSLFSGGHVTSLGIPVKTVKALDENQTFTLSVVKTENGTPDSNGDTYIYVSKHTLTLPLDQLGNSTTVNDWIYVDVDITLGEDETLAFGMPTDTVEWGYIGSKNNEYLFRSSNTSWTTVNGSSILFDVVMQKEIVFEETEHGLAAITTGSVIPSAIKDLPGSSLASSNNVVFNTAPYSYVNTGLFCGKHITSLGIPVKSVKALDDNQTFTLTVVKRDTHPYKVVSEHTLTLPLDQLGESLNVNKWIYVDLDLTLADDETLAFGGKNDTVTWGWKTGGSSQYKFRDVNNNTSNGIYFDVIYTDIYTYDEYLADLAEEEEKRKEELEKKEREEALAALLSGKNISILGDSISTFKGYSNNTSYNSTIGSNAVYYTGSNYINTVTETWWMQAIDRTDMTLLVNNSWSGDTVTGRGHSRSLQLHNNDGETPDIIAVYLGVNDFRTKVTADAFAKSYSEMIAGIREAYPDAEVYLFTLVYTTNVNSGVNPDDIIYFNEAIAATAADQGCTLVDLYNDSGINKTTMAEYMGDKNLHPNYAGMDLITDTFLNVLMEEYLFSEGDEGDNSGTEDGGEGSDTEEGGDNSGTEDDGPIVLISNDEFVYGSYFDVGADGAMKTSGAYGNIKTSHTLLPAQNITIKVEDTDLSLYKVTLGFFDADGNYKGKTSILSMTDGELTIPVSSMTSPYIRVNVYQYNGSFPKVPETAIINVYGEKPVEKHWEGKTISIIGDSISAGSYPSMLGTLSGAIIDNHAVSGSLLANKGKTMVSQLSGISADADLIIVFGGTNDYWHKNVQIGELGSADSTTYLGALDYYLSYLTANHPDAEYLFVFPADQTFSGNTSDTDFGYGTLGDFRSAFIEFCTARGVRYVDLGTSEYDCSIHSGDGVHPNSQGHQIIAEAIYDYIADIDPDAE